MSDDAGAAGFRGGGVSVVWGPDRPSRLAAPLPLPSRLDWPPVGGGGDAGAVSEQVRELRRATDRHMAVGWVGLAMFLWILVGRRVWLGEYAVAALYATPLLLVSYAAVGMGRRLFAKWGRGR